MPAAVAVPLITAAVSGTASVVGAKMASNASKNSAKTMADAGNAAAADSRQATADAMGYIERLRTQGPSRSGPAAGYLSTLMGIPGSQPMAASAQSMPTFAEGKQPDGPYMRLFGQSMPGASVPIGFTPSGQPGPMKQVGYGQSVGARSGGSV
jgi:hypothetical protein